MKGVLVKSPTPTQVKKFLKLRNPLPTWIDVLRLDSSTLGPA